MGPLEHGGDRHESDDGVAASVASGLYNLRFKRRYSLPIQEIWATLTDPERIGAWLSDADVDLRTGGHFRLRGICEVNGRIVDFEPHSLFAWTWPHPKHPESIVRWELFEDESGCRLELRQSCLSVPELVSIAAGWHTHLGVLPTAARGGLIAFRVDLENTHAVRYLRNLPTA